MHAARRVAKQFARLPYIVEPANAFLVLDRHTRWIDLLLERVGSFEFRTRPELDRREPQRQPVARHRQTRVHQDATRRVMSQASVAINTGNIDPSLTDGFDVVPLERKLCRIVQHQHWTGCRPNSIAGREEMTGENLRFTDPIVI